MKTPKEIYLFPYDDSVVWADTDESEDLQGVKYIRADQLSEIKALAIVDAINAHPEKIAYLQHAGQTRTNGVQHEIWLSSTDLMNHANKLRSEK